MRAVLLRFACVLVAVTAVPAAAQDLRTGVISDTRVFTQVESAAMSDAQPGGLPRPIHRCCHLKGFLIGAGAGAAAGWLLVASLCDAGDCTVDYIKSMALFGGIGGGLGAFVDQRQRFVAPKAAAPDTVRRVSVSGIATSRIRIATMSVRF